MAGSVSFTCASVRRKPVAGKNFLRPPAFIYDCVYREGGIDYRRHAFAFFVYRVSVQLSRAHAAAPVAAFEIHRQHMGRFDGLSGSQSRTDRFASAGKSREIVEADRPGQNHFRELLESAVYFDRRGSDSNQLRRIV